MENSKEVIKKLDSSVLSVIGNKTILGFEKAHILSNAISELKTLLTDEYMKPIMALQGNRLGFKTDKDKSGGYSIEIVKNCLIEAVLMGLQPTGNQFNIIAGNTYPTKEGCGYLLANFEGLKYDLVCSLPKINSDKSSSAVDVLITYTINGETKEKSIPIPIKMDAYTSVDAIIGKATRKGRAWLLNTLSGIEVTDGDINDISHTVISTKIVDKEAERIVLMINSANSAKELVESLKDVTLNDEQTEILNLKLETLNKK